MFCDKIRYVVKKVSRTKAVSFEEQHEKMLNTPIPKLVTSLSVPTALAQLITVIYNTADTWFVSKISTSASAAVGVVFSVMSIIQAIGFGIGMGTGSRISVLLGEKKNDEAEKYTASGMAMALVMGVLVGAVGLFCMKPLLLLVGSTDTILPYACDYATFIFLNAPVMCCSFVLSNVLRAEGEATYASVALCTGGIVNMILDPVFIFVMGWGTAGAAGATAISQIVGFLLLLSAYLRGRSMIKLNLRKASKDIHDYFKIITIGFPTICRQSLGSIATALLNGQASVYGDAAIAAVTIATKVYMLIRNLVIGIGQGFQPVAGYNFGAGDKKRTGRAFLFACAVGSAFCLVFALLTGIFSESIITWFRDDAEVVEVGKVMLGVFAFSIPFMAFSTYVNQMYQCLGFRTVATSLASCRQGIFFIPVLFVSTHFWGLGGVQITQGAADILTFIVSVPFCIYFFKKHLKAEKAE